MTEHLQEKTTSKTTIDADEVAKFTAMADEWWDLHGKFKSLHVFNPIRIAYIRDTVAAHFGKNTEEDTPLSGLSFLDIGCGGGLLAEPLTRLGAKMTALDASEKNIKIAKLHAEQGDLTIDYQHKAAETLAETGAQFDVVMAMEVVEHVADVEHFIASAAKMVKPGGLLFMATLNRTLKSYALAIIGAEYILRWLPRGTHDWNKFLRPSELEVHIRHNGLHLEALQGVTFNPLNNQWKLSKDVNVNYMLYAEKK